MKDRNLIDRLYDRQVCSVAQNRCRNDDRLDAAIEALAASEARERTLMERLTWRPIETAPIDGTRFIATLQVRDNKTGATWWEPSVVWMDVDVNELSGDCDTGWPLSSYSHWLPLPGAPAPETGDGR